MTPNQQDRALKNASRWLHKYRRAARQTLGPERAKYQQAARNYRGWISTLRRDIANRPTEEGIEMSKLHEAYGWVVSYDAPGGTKWYWGQKGWVQDRHQAKASMKKADMISLAQSLVRNAPALQDRIGVQVNAPKLEGIPANTGEDEGFRRMKRLAARPDSELGPSARRAKARFLANNKKADAMFKWAKGVKEDVPFAQPAGGPDVPWRQSTVKVPYGQFDFSGKRGKEDVEDEDDEEKETEPKAKSRFDLKFDESETLAAKVLEAGERSKRDIYNELERLWAERDEMQRLQRFMAKWALIKDELGISDADIQALDIETKGDGSKWAVGIYLKEPRYDLKMQRADARRKRLDREWAEKNPHLHHSQKPSWSPGHRHSSSSYIALEQPLYLPKAYFKK